MNNDQTKNTIMRPAICTQCGAQIEVDAQREKAFCQYCGTPFIVEKAIHTYNVQHATVEHVDSINIIKPSAVESVLNFVRDQQKRADEERKEEERKKKEEEERQKEEEARQREEEAREREEERKKKEKADKYWWVYLIPLAIMVVILNFYSHEIEKNKIPINSSSSELKGANYKDVVTKLTQDGFTNIKTEEKKDLVFGWLAKDGGVERVEIDGDYVFDSGTKFSKDADIIVTYHTFRWEKDRNAVPSPVAPGN